MDKMFCHSGRILVKTCDEQTLFGAYRGSFNQEHSNTPSVFGGCYCKPWLQALVVYFVLPFSWRPSHDNAVGTTDKAGQKFHRRTTSYQDNG